MTDRVRPATFLGSDTIDHTDVAWYPREQAAERAGVEPRYIARLTDLGVLTPEGEDRLSSGDIRRVLMARSLEAAGIPLREMVDAIRRGALSLDFLDAASYERVARLADETFEQVSDRTGIPLGLLMVVREAVGMAQPSPDDRLREDEMAIVPFIELQIAEGFHPSAIERVLRVQGDSTRRIADAEAAWWNTEVIEPAMAADDGPQGISNADLADRIAPLMEQSVLAMYHIHQARAWTANIIEGFEGLMAEAGIRSRLERLPAICFLDITGYTRLTQERGDDEAANLATTVARLVQRCSVQRGGKTIKWLGDGVMFYFDDPVQGVRAALEMVAGLADAGLPPAHVGLHAGPVLFQEGDYFGQTVNLAARIADVAQAGEVLVSQVVADAGRSDGLVFDEVGAVELKGVSGPVPLFRAQPDPGSPNDG
jgi:adenylate cyclase